MNKPHVPQMFKNAREVLSKHSPEILMGIGIASMTLSTVFAVKATPKALQLIEEEKDILEKDKLTPTETIKATWKCYIPAATAAIVGATCCIGSCSINMRRNAALTALYKISDTAIEEYREQVIETIGEKKEQAIQEKVNQKQIDKTPVDEHNIYNTGRGNTLFLDPLSQRYFRSDLEYVRRAENNLNKEILHSIYGTVNINDFYDELGIPRTDTGDMMGWSTDRMMDLNITPGMTDWGEPCIVVAHYVRPDYMP